MEVFNIKNIKIIILCTLWGSICGLTTRHLGYRIDFPTCISTLICAIGGFTIGLLTNRGE